MVSAVPSVSVMVNEPMASAVEAPMFDIASDMVKSPVVDEYKCIVPVGASSRLIVSSVSVPHDTLYEPAPLYDDTGSCTLKPNKSAIAGVAAMHTITAITDNFVFMITRPLLTHHKALPKQGRLSNNPNDPSPTLKGGECVFL